METMESSAAERARAQGRERANNVHLFMRFAGVYLALGLFFLFINLFFRSVFGFFGPAPGFFGPGPGFFTPTLWFFWPMLALTIPLVILAWRAVAEPRVHEQRVERQVQRSVNHTSKATRQPTRVTEADTIEPPGIEFARKRARERARHIREFMRFAGVYLAVGMFFFLINLFSGMGEPWFFWPMLPLTIPLVILAWRAFAEPRFDDQWVERQVQKSVSSQQNAAPRRMDEESEIDTIEKQAADLIDGMRRSARQIPTPAVRTQALDVCAAADRALSAISENPDEVVLARDFVGRYLTPASTILNDYARLASRNVASAEPTLRRVEEHDLPLLEEKLDEVHDRLHRGSIIDLQVAREMLSLDVSDWGIEEIEDASTVRPTSTS